MGKLQGFWSAKGYRIEQDGLKIYHATAKDAIKEMCKIALHDITKNTGYSIDEITPLIEEK